MAIRVTLLSHHLPSHIIYTFFLIMSSPADTTAAPTAGQPEDKGDALDQGVAMLTKKGGHATVSSLAVASDLLEFSCLCFRIAKPLRKFQTSSAVSTRRPQAR